MALYWIKQSSSARFELLNCFRCNLCGSRELIESPRHENDMVSSIFWSESQIIRRLFDICRWNCNKTYWKVWILHKISYRANDRMSQIWYILSVYKLPAQDGKIPPKVNRKWLFLPFLYGSRKKIIVITEEIEQPEAVKIVCRTKHAQSVCDEGR